ncbi:MAG: FtsQ-type POTRA domain-containing protein [Bryobacteraceae bacterium]|nr:FtsQ-type POTRA domain-containing protein [Bryobacteraceae bacterium]
MGRRAQNSVTAHAVALPSGASGALGRVLRLLDFAFRWFFGIALAIGVVWGTVTLEQFFINDKRFALPGPPEPGTLSDSFVIEGSLHASEAQITDLFLRDFGRSIYLCPIQERRRRLLGIDWVRNASVSRIWPNRIVVRVWEREPVAVVQVPGPDTAMLYSLIDADGVLLDPRRVTRLALPVISGISPTDKEASRRERVKRFLRLQSELGSEMANISEVDLTELDNIRVVRVMDGRALTLMLGNRDFQVRWQSFLDNYSEIRKRLGNASVLDLRLRDRITAVATEELRDE